MKHIKGINEGMPFFTTFSGPVTFMNAVKIYDKNDFFKFDKEETLKHIINEHDKLIPYGNGRSYGDSALSSNIINVVYSIP